MKRIFLLSIIFFCTLSFASADTSRFFKGGKVIKMMYVTAEDGLRVRDKPNLGSNKICGLSYRIPVKIIAIGKEATIDGITAPWVEILIPRYEWKGKKPEFGWVFGGYLSEEKPKFIEPKNAKELSEYLSSFMSWGFYDKYSEWIGFMHFYKDGSFSEIHPSPEDPSYNKKDSSWSDGSKWYGTWKALDKNTFSVSAKNKDSGEERTRTVTLTAITDVWWSEANTGNSGSSMFDPKPVDGVAHHEIKTMRDASILKSKGAYFDDYWGPIYPTRSYDDENYTIPTDLERKYIEAGIDVYYDSDQFNSYWAPIIAEHQKRADLMK